MASTYDLTTDRGKVRLQLGDTSTTAGEYVFEDDEIDYFLDVGGSVAAAVLEGLQVLLNSHAHRAKRATILGVSIDDTAQLDALRQRIRDLGGGLPTVGTLLPALIPSDHGFDYSDP